MQAKQVRETSHDGVIVDRLVALASAPWVDPNERCACVTLALALLVCPEKVGVTPSEFADADDLEYRNVRLALPRAASPSEGPFAFFDPRGHHVLAFDLDDVDWVGALPGVVRAGRVRRLEIQRVNGIAVRSTPVASALESAGFVPTPRGVVLRS